MVIYYRKNEELIHWTRSCAKSDQTQQCEYIANTSRAKNDQTQTKECKHLKYALLSKFNSCILYELPSKFKLCIFYKA